MLGDFVGGDGSVVVVGVLVDCMGGVKKVERK